MGSERPIERVLGCLEGVEARNGQYRALCPAHPDRNTPNLSIAEKGDGTVLVHCFVCKDQEKILRALEERSVSKSDLFGKNGKGPNRNGSRKAK